MADEKRRGSRIRRSACVRDPDFLTHYNDVVAYLVFLFDGGDGDLVFMRQTRERITGAHRVNDFANRCNQRCWRGFILSLRDDVRIRGPLDLHRCRSGR